MKVKFIFSSNYETALSRIEDHFFEATGSIIFVESFLKEHDDALMFIGENPKTPAIHPVTGDQSWIFGNGRYRLFFRCIDNNNETIVSLTHLIDNKELNQNIYPSNKIPTYDED